ncbi:MAG: hypothetical protein QXL88_00145 [Candidatus Pacearchaeota archaeon]
MLPQEEFYDETVRKAVQDFCKKHKEFFSCISELELKASEVFYKNLSKVQSQDLMWRLVYISLYTHFLNKNKIEEEKSFYTNSFGRFGRTGRAGLGIRSIIDEEYLRHLIESGYYE